MVWGCISYDCKLDLVTVQGNLTGDQSHFDKHPLAPRPVYMDDNTRPHRAGAITAYLLTAVPWSAISPDLNPLEYICASSLGVEYRKWNHLYRICVNWRQLCIGSGCSCPFRIFEFGLVG